MRYTIDYYDKSNLSKLMSVWQSLEGGNDMTYFQSYDWYRYLNDHYVSDDTHEYVSVYVLVKRDETALLIAPLWIALHTFKLVNKKGVYFLGREGWSDYLNFVYDEFDEDALLFLFQNVRKKYKIRSFYFEMMKVNTQSYAFINRKMKTESLRTETCVNVILPDSVEEYKKMLSKNSRQNIRTAHNRLKKDGIDVNVVFDDKNVNKEKCREIRETRFEKKFERISKIRRWKYTVMRRLTFRFRSYTPFLSYDKGHFLTVYHGNELCSFFYYLYEPRHKRILVQAAGVNMNYAKYSPGIISLFDFISSHIAAGDIAVIDFTRGDEKYKYTLGGSDHYIDGLSFTI